MQATELKPATTNCGETITLEYPITIDGAVINRIRLRRPLVRDRLIAEKASGSEVEKEIRLLANLCEIAPDHIEKLDLKDYGKLQERLIDFLS